MENPGEKVAQKPQGGDYADQGPTIIYHQF